MRPSGPLIGEYGVCNSQDSLITRRSSRLMHLLLEWLGRGVHVLAEVHAVLFSWKDGSSTQSVSTEVRASVFLHTDLCCNLFTSSCEDRGASGSTEVPNGSSVAPAVNAWLDKRSRLFLACWCGEWSCGDNRVFPFLLTVVLVIAFLLRLSFFLVLLQTGTYPRVRGETYSCLWLYRHPTLAMKTKLRSLHVCNSGHAKCRMD